MYTDRAELGQRQSLFNSVLLPAQMQEAKQRRLLSGLFLRDATMQAGQMPWQIEFLRRTPNYSAGAVAGLGGGFSLGEMKLHGLTGFVQCATRNEGWPKSRVSKENAMQKKTGKMHFTGGASSGKSSAIHISTSEHRPPLNLQLTWFPVRPASS